VDGTSLKVFKYTLAGSLLGSWAIDPADAHPTGITINPANVSDLWIVDNGTDKVYQYVGAAGRTSGSQTAAATFALAAGDTNPQGIADPPAPGDRLDDGRTDPIRVAPAKPDHRPRPAVLPGREPAGGREAPVTSKAPTRQAVADAWAGPAWAVGPARRKAALYADWLAAGNNL
jgi:hypothetical protein